ncbi:MAG TPA: hypothetical protein VF516_36395 [Kofleriaceae bacterium]
MRMLIATLLVLAGACTGAAPGGSRTCAGNLYDACLTEHDCMMGNCVNFMAARFQVCSVSCTVGDDTPCMTNDRGQKASCMPISAGSSNGVCTPPAENDCTRAP